MDDALTIQCPHCGEFFTTPLDASEGDAEFVIDCEVCCRPMTVKVRLANGQLESFEVFAD